jgi:hypothetical protein
MTNAIHTLRVKSKPIAFRLFRNGFIVPIACFAVGMVFADENRIMAMRCFGGTFGFILIGFVIYFFSVTLDELINRDYLTSIWMAIWTGIVVFMVFTGFRMAFIGF